MAEKEKREITHSIDEHIGIISESAKGWTRELNKVTWNNGMSKFDVRDWSPDHETCGKGLTLTDEEALKLRDLISLSV